jgi:hypothetical protein
MTSEFKLEPPRTLGDGITVTDVSFPAGPAFGRCVTIDISKVSLDLLVFYDLINRSFNKKWGCSFPLQTSSGVNLPQLFSDDKDALKETKPELERIEAEPLTRCLLACNTTHTNFVRGNGFVVTRDSTLVFKPNGALALDADSYVPLNGAYTAIVIRENAPWIVDILIRDNHLVDPMESVIAISGPRIVERSLNVAHIIPVRSKY